jgi:hypothetical protein
MSGAQELAIKVLGDLNISAELLPSRRTRFAFLDIQASVFWA